MWRIRNISKNLDHFVKHNLNVDYLLFPLSVHNGSEMNNPTRFIFTKIDKSFTSKYFSEYLSESMPY